MPMRASPVSESSTLIAADRLLRPTVTPMPMIVATNMYSVATIPASSFHNLRNMSLSTDVGTIEFPSACHAQAVFPGTASIALSARCPGRFGAYSVPWPTRLASEWLGVGNPSTTGDQFCRASRTNFLKSVAKPYRVVCVWRVRNLRITHRNPSMQRTHPDQVPKIRSGNHYFPNLTWGNCGGEGSIPSRRQGPGRMAHRAGAEESIRFGAKRPLSLGPSSRLGANHVARYRRILTKQC